jgi:hypothetical protein
MATLFRWKPSEIQTKANRFYFDAGKAPPNDLMTYLDRWAKAEHSQGTVLHILAEGVRYGHDLPDIDNNLRAVTSRVGRRLEAESTEDYNVFQKLPRHEAPETDPDDQGDHFDRPQEPNGTNGAEDAEGHGAKANGGGNGTSDHGTKANGKGGASQGAKGADWTGTEAPRPLMRELPPADPFPVDALGTTLGNAARAIHDRIQAPVAICGQSVLAAAALAVQGHADVLLPIGQTRPISEYFLAIARTGERKTATDSEALRPARKREADLREQYDVDLPNYLNDMVAWEKARDHAVRVCKGDRDKIKAALDQLGPPPAEPLIPILTCQEPTFEGYCKLASRGHASLGIFASEGGQFIAGHGMSVDNRLKTAAGLSSLWDGETIKRVRAGDGAGTLAGRRVSMHIMAQPDVAALWLADPVLIEQGLMSRCLPTAPDSTSGTRFQRPEQAGTKVYLTAYQTCLDRIFAADLPLAYRKINELAPPVVTLSAEAARMWLGSATHSCSVLSNLVRS